MKTLAALLLMAGFALADEVEIRGRAVDAAGAGVAGIEVATFWSATPRGMVAHESAMTDAEGAFTLKVRLQRSAVALIGFSKDRESGGIVTLSKTPPTEELELRMEKTLGVKGRFSCPDLGAPPPWMNVYVMAMPGNARVAQCSTSGAAISLVLPTGNYQFHMYGTDVRDRTEAHFLDSDDGDFDFGLLELAATRLAKCYGAPPPAWNVTEARGAAKGVQPGDFKGRWLLLEFWGFW
ncbi:MAG: hypothetical protein ACT4PV_15805 [Planctomycetaceae bacterium]